MDTINSIIDSILKSKAYVQSVEYVQQNVLGAAPTLHVQEPEFFLCVFIAVFMGVQCMVQGYMVPMARFQIYTKEYFLKHFPEFKGWTPHEGYPDMGCGYYSKHLSHEHWLLINNAQRAHYNHLEQLTSNVLTLLVAGAFYPTVSARIGVCVVVGRMLYSLGYTQIGARARTPGGIIAALGSMGLTALAMYGAYNFAGGSAAFLKLLSFNDGPAAAAAKEEM